MHQLTGKADRPAEEASGFYPLLKNDLHLRDVTFRRVNPIGGVGIDTHRRAEPEEIDGVCSVAGCDAEKIGRPRHNSHFQRAGQSRGRRVG